MSKRVKVAKISIGVIGKESTRNRHGEELAKKCILRAIGTYLPGENVEVDITMTDKDQIREINSGKRGVDKVTDVLSFPLLDMREGVPLHGIQREPDGSVLLGDILMCYDMGKEQAEEYGHGEDRECAYLAVHSVLHLLGFDHEDEGEMKKNMRKAEEDILSHIL